MKMDIRQKSSFPYEALEALLHPKIDTEFWKRLAPKHSGSSENDVIVWIIRTTEGGTRKNETNQTEHFEDLF